MPILYHRTVAFLSLALLMGCGGAEEKLANLEAVRDEACATARQDSVALVTFLNPRTTADSARFAARQDSVARNLPVDTLGAASEKSRLRCQLAMREYDRFMK